MNTEEKLNKATELLHEVLTIEHYSTINMLKRDIRDFLDMPNPEEDDA